MLGVAGPRGDCAAADLDVRVPDDRERAAAAVADDGGAGRGSRVYFAVHIFQGHPREF